MQQAPNIAPTPAMVPPPAIPGPARESSAKDTADFGFWDLLDIINPLQHIPVVSTIYRAITGDELKGTARIVGGALFGGPIGAAFAVVNAIFEDASGRDLGDHALAMAMGGEWGGERGGDQGPPIVAAAGATDLPFEPAPIQQQATAPAPDTVLAGQLLFAPPMPIVPVAVQDLGVFPTTTPASPAWITQAMAQAQEVRDGGPAQITAQPWLADAMLHALDKYANMAKADMAKSGPDGDREPDDDRDSEPGL